MTADALEPGVHTSTAPVRELEAAYAAQGWRTAVVGDAATKREVLAAMADALDLPDHFGHNLDALWDCLTDLTEPTVLVWSGWEALAVRHPRDWAALIDVLRERTQAEPAFAVVLGQGA